MDLSLFYSGVLKNTPLCRLFKSLSVYLAWMQGAQKPKSETMEIYVENVCPGLDPGRFAAERGR